MKKSIDFLNMNSELLEWLMAKLKAVPAAVKGADELYKSFKSLASGESASLMIELTEDGTHSVPGEDIHCGELDICALSRQVIRNGEEIQLTPKEFDILYFLARNKGEVFTKEQIYNAVWEGSYLLDDSNIMAFIRKIRKKIEPNPDDPRYIITIWGIGYKFSDK